MYFDIYSILEPFQLDLMPIHAASVQCTNETEVSQAHISNQSGMSKVRQYISEIFRFYPTLVMLASFPRRPFVLMYLFVCSSSSSQT
jgi:hypothetical protein